MGFAFQQSDLQDIQSKRRLSYSDKQLQNLDSAYGPMLAQGFAQQSVVSNVVGMCFQEKHGDMMSLQNRNFALMRQQGGTDGD